MPGSAIIAPASIFKSDDRTLSIVWNDDSKSHIDVHRLRASCPCAQCVNEWTGERMIRPEAIPQDIRPQRLFSVGRYAMGIEWSDGHRTGIFSYDYLKSLGKAGAPANGA